VESDASVFGVGVGLEALLVDDDVVVVPAEGDEIVWVCWSALAPGCDVVGLEPVAGVAAVCCAGVVVAVEDGAV
jgi:hypothetical protein